MATPICEKCGNPPNMVQVTGMERGRITRIGMCCPCDSIHDIDPTDVSMISDAINREELAWAAGFYDGEGHARARKYRPDKSKSRSLQITVVQKDRQLLDRFQRAIGGLGKITVRQNGIHALQISNFRDCKAVIDLLFEWLGPVKRQQAAMAVYEVEQWHQQNGGIGRWPS